MALSRKSVVDLMNQLGYSEAAEEASRVLPDPVDLEELKKLSDRYGISRAELESRMGSSP